MTPTVKEIPAPGLDLTGFAPWRFIALACCVMINMVEGFDVLSIAFTSTYIISDWGISPKELGFLFSAALAGMALGSILLAPMADKYGRRPIILAGLGLSTLGMAAASFTPGYTALLGFRFITGLGVGALISTLNTTIAEHATNKHRSVWMALFATAFPIGSALGGMLAPFLVEQFGWRSVFLAGGLVTAFLGALAYFAVPETIAYLVTRQPPGALRRVNAILVRFRQAPVSEFPAASPMSKPTLLKSLKTLFQKVYFTRSMLMGVVFVFGQLTAYFILNWTPKILVDLGFAHENAVMGSAMITFGGAIGGLLAGLLGMRWDGIVIASVSYLLCFIALCFFGAVGPHLEQALALCFLIGFFLWGGTTGKLVALARIYPAEVRASGAGFCFAIGRIGAVLGPIMAGFLISAGVGRLTLVVSLALPLIVVAVLMLTLRRFVGEDAAVTH